MEQGPEGTRPGFLQAFEGLEDPRTRNCPHRLDELLLVALCAITSGADSWMSVVDWGRMKLDWLRRFLPFDNGIASHDTFTRVFSLLDAQRFEACFIRWMRQLCPALQGDLVSIDGKSVRGSHDARAAKSAGGYAVQSRASHRGRGVLRLALGKAASNPGDSSPLMSATRTCARQCAPSSDQRICCFFAMRRLTTSLTADSAMLLLIGRPFR
jgi:hypothetical protein